MSLARAFGACDPYVFHATGNLDSPHRVFEFCIPIEVSMEVVVSFSNSSVSEAMSLLLTVPTDDSGILSWLGVVCLKTPRDGHHRIRGVAETGIVLLPCHDSLWCLGLSSHYRFCGVPRHRG